MGRAVGGRVWSWRWPARRQARRGRRKQGKGAEAEKRPGIASGLLGNPLETQTTGSDRVDPGPMQEEGAIDEPKQLRRVERTCLIYAVFRLIGSLHGGGRVAFGTMVDWVILR